MAIFAVISVPKEKALETKFTTTINPLVITACAHRNSRGVAPGGSGGPLFSSQSRRGHVLNND